MAHDQREVIRVVFSVEDHAQIVAYMAQLTSGGDGWINLIPKLDDDDDRPTTLGFFTLFGGGGINLTMCTWIPGSHDRPKQVQPNLGITHLTRRRAAAQLSSFGVPIPQTWVVEQDHPARGLVLRLPWDEPHEQMIRWALRAVAVLSPRPIRGWRGEIYLPADS